MPKFTLCISTALILCGTLHPLHSADRYWGGNASGSLQDLANWWQDANETSAAAAIPGAADLAIFNTSLFGAPDNVISTLGANTSLQGMLFNGASTSAITLGTLNDFTLTLGSAGITQQTGAAAVAINSNIIVGAVQSWNNQSLDALTIAGNVALNNNLTLSGTGPISITGPITTSGNRTLTVSNTGDVSIGSFINTGTFTFNVGTDSSLDANGVLSGSGAIEKNGAGTLFFNNANTNTGNLRIRDGTVYATQSNIGGLQLIFGANASTIGTDGPGTLTLDNNSAVEFKLGNTVFVHLTSDGGLINSDGGGAATPFVSLNATRTFMIRDAAPDVDLRVSVGIANGTAASGINKRSTGTLLLEGVNTYTGVTSVDRGKLILDYQLNNDDNKLSNSTATNLRGGTLELRSHNTNATSETVGSMGIGPGASTLNLVSVNGQTLDLNVTGNLTRAANTGVVNLVTATPALAHLNVTGAGTVNNTSGFLGGWFTYNGNRWATRQGNEIVALAGTLQNDKSLWTNTDNIIVNTPTTGSLNTPEIASLILDNPAGGIVALDNHASALTLSQSSLLVSSNTTSDVTLSGGQLMTKNAAFNASNELIITNLSAATFNLGTNLGTSNTFLTAVQNVTLAGPGLINLTGASSTTPAASFTIHGNVQLSSSNAFGSYSAVVIGGGGDMTTNGARLAINGGTAVIGRLSGGVSGDHNFQELGNGEVALGTNGNLTINQTADGTYSGLFSGSGTLIKKGAAALTLQSTTSTFNGQVQAFGGTVNLTGSANTLSAISSLLIRGGSVSSSQNQDNTGINHIRDAATITMQGTTGNGLMVTSSRNTLTQTEVFGVLNLDSSSNTLTVDNTIASPTGATAAVMTFGQANSLTRSNKSTLLVRGRNLGLTTPVAGTPASRVTFTNTTAIDAALIGSSSTALSTMLRILPYGIGESNSTSTATLAAVGNSFLTYGAGGTGLRTLTDAEYAASFITDTNVSLNATTGSLAGGTLNSLRIVNNSGTNPVALTGSGDLILTSGALLMTAGATDNDASISGFSSLTSGTTVAELNVFVTSSNSIPSNTTLTLNTAIIDNGQPVSLTKSGGGTLVLTGNNTYTGETTINQGVVEFGNTGTGNLGSGLLRLAGGTLRWATGNTTDITAGNRTVQFLGSSVYLTPSAGGNVLNPGSTFDTGANNVTLANAIGNNGYGGLTKTGTGILTLSAAPTYTGATTIMEGTINFQTIAPDTSDALYLIRTATGTGTVSATVANGLNVKSLVVGGAYGADAGSTTGNLTVSSGAVNINDSGGFVLIGYRDSSSGTGNTVTTTSTANFTNASSVTLNTAQLELGGYRGGVGTVNLSSIGVLQLSNGANQITTGSIIVGHAPSSISNVAGTSTITLGSSSNIINTDTMVLGGARSRGTVTIRSGGSFTLRGRQGGDTGANLFIGDNDATGTGVDTIGLLDLTNASNVDAIINQLIIGRLAGTTAGGSGQGTLTFDTGSINATTILLATPNYSTGVTTNDIETQGTINQWDDATLRFMNLSQGRGTANYNWQGGTIQNLAGADQTNQNVTVTLNGAGSATDPSLRTFTVDENQTATFQADAEFAGAGSFTKNGEGDLNLLGTNINTGNVHIAQGTLSLEESGSMNDAAWFNIATDATLKVADRTTSSYASDAVISGTGIIDATDGTFTVGSNIGTINTVGSLRPGASSTNHSLASATTVGDLTGSLTIQGNLVLEGDALPLERAVLQLASSNRNASSSLGNYANIAAWVDNIDTDFASFM
ncbi:hypothetical protein FEM03_23700, partial [Phragmitibacter flavus]